MSTNSKPFIYVACAYTAHGPYKHSDEITKLIHDVNAASADRLCAHIFSSGKGFPISPISHWHRAAKSSGLPTDAESWYEYNSALQAMCSETWVIANPPALQSEGVKVEIEDALRLGQRVLAVAERVEGYGLSISREIASYDDFVEFFQTNDYSSVYKTSEIY